MLSEPIGDRLTPMRIRAFRGIRSREGQDPGRLAAPPYDQIDPARRDVFHQTPYHFTHLSCPVDLAGGDPYAFAARLHRDRHDTAAIAEDAVEGLYVLDLE